jgi:uncharacterized membrane protein
LILRSGAENEDEGIIVSSRILNLMIFGIVLVFVGIVVVVIASISLGSGNVGAVIFIGPFPIVFGSGQNVSWLIFVGIILSVVSIILFFLLNRRWGKYSY